MKQKIPRIPFIDDYRGVLVLFMVFYHFVFDLTYFFGFDFAFFESDWFGVIANFVRISFLLLVGVSSRIIFLNSPDLSSYNRKQFGRIRNLLLVALLISVATYFFTEGFIFFGILHLIAFGLLFLLSLNRLWSLVLFLGVNLLLSLKFDFWANVMGLKKYTGFSLDFFPVLPWIFVILVGYYSFDFCKKYLLLIPASRFRFLSYCGKRAFLIYVLHQPLFLFLIFIVRKSLHM